MEYTNDRAGGGTSKRGIPVWACDAVIPKWTKLGLEAKTCKFLKTNSLAAVPESRDDRAPARRLPSSALGGLPDENLSRRSAVFWLLRPDFYK